MDVPAAEAALHCLRERLSTANLKQPLRATRLSAPSGAVHSAITKLSNQTHKQILFEEQYVASLESLKDKFGRLTSATTTPGLLKAMLNALCVQRVDVLPHTLGVDVNA